MTTAATPEGRPGTDRRVGPDGVRRPAVLVFDVNETLSDMSSMGRRFADVGAPAHLARTWFAGLLRDGFALAAVDTIEPFARIAAEGLRVSLHGLALDRPVEDAVSHVLEGFSALAVHPDVSDGIRALRGLGIRLVTLSNGSAAVAESLLARAGLSDCFEALLSVEDAGIWKPAANAYAHALDRCALEAGEAMLVAVHPWDIDGAARAGLATAWVTRDDGRYPDYFHSPDLRARSLTDLADQLR